MKNTIESQIEYEILQIIIDVEIMQTIIQNAFDNMHGFKEPYKNEMENYTILLERMIRIVRGKLSKVNEKVFQYMHQ